MLLTFFLNIYLRLKPRVAPVFLVLWVNYLIVNCFVTASWSFKQFKPNNFNWVCQSGVLDPFPLPGSTEVLYKPSCWSRLMLRLFVMDLWSGYISITMTCSIVYITLQIIFSLSGVFSVQDTYWTEGYAKASLLEIQID